MLKHSLMKRLFVLITLLLPADFQATAYGQSAFETNWHHWRGPSANGKAVDSARPPIMWGSTKNVRWSTELRGEGSSTPIVWNDQIFVLSAEATNRKAEIPPQADPAAKTVPPDVYYKYWVTSIDRATGKKQWEKLATEQVPHEGKHQTHTYAASSPTTDGEHLYVSFASRGIYCYTLSGDLVWQTDLGDMQTRLGWGESVTPVLVGDLLIINWDQEQDSFIAALDKRTGQEVWRNARDGEATSWNTPLIVEYSGKSLIVVNGTQRVRAYDAATGKEIWNCGGQTVNAIPSPVQFGDSVICMSGYRGAMAVAIPIDSRGDVTDSPDLLWKLDQGTPYVPSPAVSEGWLYFTGTNADILSCVDAKTGKPLAERKRLSGVVGLYSSPLVAGGHVYFAGREGTTVVIKDSPALEIVAVNKLDGTLDASPIAVGSELYLRSWSKLICIAED